MPLLPHHRAEAAAFRARKAGGLKIHALRVARVDRLTDDAVAITFDVPPPLRDDFRHLPGQHVTILHADGRRVVRRPYSICSRPGEDLRIGVRRIDGGVFSTYATGELGPGATVQVAAPTGSFSVAPRPDRRRHYGLVAAGSGITPILSIAATVLETEPHSAVSLVYANRSRAARMFGSELDALAARHRGRLRLWHVLSREDPDELGCLTGRLSAELLGQTVDLAGVDEWFLCAPEPLVDALDRDLTALGVEPDRLHRELFHTDAEPTDPETRPELTCEVELRIAGERTVLELSSRGPTVLAAGRAAGLDLPYSCTEGVCSTCRARLLEGQAEMDRNASLDRRQLAAGYVLACQAHPVSPRVVLDFDPVP